VKTFNGEFKDVYQATSIYCKRRLRNEIGARSFTGAGERERTAPEGGPESNAQATHLSSQGESLPPEKVVADHKADDDRGAGIAECWQGPESATLDEMAESPAAIAPAVQVLRRPAPIPESDPCPGG